ncbi:MAG: hypothetical protein SFV81_03950, partial [Pirellulaceae bacterium]|nr:hypothetical protein [Pirellulaceae bacterium]
MRIEILAAYRRSGMKSGVLRTSASSLLKRPYNKSKRLIAITWEPVTGFELKVLEGGIPFSDRVDIFQRELASIHPSNQPNPSVLNGTLSLLWTSIEFEAPEAIRLAATIDTNLSDFSKLPLIDLGDGETAVQFTLKVDCYHQGMQ